MATFNVNRIGCKRLVTYLGIAFDWASTSEGFEFWDSVCNKLTLWSRGPSETVTDNHAIVYPEDSAGLRIHPTSVQLDPCRLFISMRGTRDSFRFQETAWGWEFWNKVFNMVALIGETEERRGPQVAPITRMLRASASVVRSPMAQTPPNDNAHFGKKPKWW